MALKRSLSGSPDAVAGAYKMKTAGVPHSWGPETTPVKFTTHLMDLPRMPWYNGQRHQFTAQYKEKSWLETWPARRGGWEKGSRAVLTKNYHPEAIKEALKMVPLGFEVRDIPRPPQRIRAQSEGIVGRWFTNYWTLHSIKYQCMLGGMDWSLGERVRPTTNYDQPFNYVDFEMTKAVRDHRSKFINVNRSMVGMSKKIKEVDEVKRFAEHKRFQEEFWSKRKILINRVKSMYSQGLLTSAEELPVTTMNIKAFAKQE